MCTFYIAFDRCSLLETNYQLHECNFHTLHVLYKQPLICYNRWRLQMWWPSSVITYLHMVHDGCKLQKTFGIIPLLLNTTMIFQVSSLMVCTLPSIWCKLKRVTLVTQYLPMNMYMYRPWDIQKQIHALESALMIFYYYYYSTYIHVYTCTIISFETSHLKMYMYMYSTYNYDDMQYLFTFDSF